MGQVAAGVAVVGAVGYGIYKLVTSSKGPEHAPSSRRARSPSPDMSSRRGGYTSADIDHARSLGEEAGAQREIRAQRQRDAAAAHAKEFYPKPVWLRTAGQINIAITGLTGAGKSSLINALRRLRPNDPEAAPTGTVETTMAPTCWTLKVQAAANCFVVVNFWHLPGAGTPAFPREIYIQKMGLRHFDSVVLVSSTRFTETEMLINQHLLKFQVQTVMVRTKVDQDVDNELDKGIDEDAALTKIRADLLRRTGIREAFLVSSKPRFWQSFDMNALGQRLMAECLAARGVPGAHGVAQVLNTIRG
mmetsp:Transcript_79575/g.200145  ORF Transcript_79575/g.200145 Transcript_79575/m.200145 type:complete len:304 (+) Transcript_79575:54-965(+)|eukprot:CAMPEP_0115394118 /NCGR_PEP_ID=MMETSP0271-20121206/12100_1 /TAXON_ID=71861 /ORGANISM="Scrippsiella trochoidea, Strain CCMP3099" /LENGTH=303 /DNA_ID=CAMNT_0002817777 /DNA_START=28 /DNA_END=939 /DNA_ORIENTATION=+